MPKIFLDTSLHYDAIGNSQVYAAAFLHKIVLGRCTEDLRSQLYFSEKTLRFQSSEFNDVIAGLCEGLGKLEEIEAGNEDIEFEKGMIFHIFIFL